MAIYPYQTEPLTSFQVPENVNKYEEGLKKSKKLLRNILRFSHWWEKN